ncbi:MAG: hypothetical protein M1828_004806 [Chrysothrix sp. TS-e1954]|nr:MAG: hypothetical protein M1828_004806 [Chrysothrix sp. TS-e1954]
MALSSQDLYPLPVQSRLEQQFLGKDLGDVDCPMAVIDRAVARRNCSNMLDAARTLKLSFRAHVKTHKHLVSKGGQYGSSPIPVFVKCDSGYHRAGIPTYGQDFKTLIQTISTSDHVRLVGFYTHSSLSYNASNPEEALQYLETEISCGREAVWIAQRTLPEWKSRHFIVSVGATPSVSSVQNLLSDSERARTTRSQLENVKTEFELELHAGVYSLLDLQQVATHARPAQAGNEDISPTMTTDDIGFRILAEVLSVYNERPKPEALIGAGTLALGREPCKSYPGWAIVAPSPWNSHKGADATGDDDIAGGTRSIYSEDHRTGWIVDRVSQEHGILAWHSEQPVTDGIASPVRLNAQDGLNVGQKLVLWPNHACIAGAGFPFYLVIDSEARANSSRTEIVDVWVRARGW